MVLKRCHVMGVDWRGFLLENPSDNDANVESLVALWREGLIRPGVHASFSFEEAPRAIQIVEHRQAMGKVIVRVST